MKFNTKTIIFSLVIVLSLGLILTYLVRKKTAVSSSEQGFLIADTSLVKSIIIQNQEDTNQIIHLTKKNDKWLINNNIEASPKPVRLLLQTVSHLDFRFPVKKNQMEKINSDLKNSGLLVSFFSDEQLITKYFVGGQDENQSGNYFMIYESDYPVVLSFPAFDGSLQNIFGTSENYWREHTLKMLIPSKITEVRVHYPDNFSSSFFIRIDGRKVSLFDIKNKQVKGKINEDYIWQYLSRFSSIDYEKYVHNPDKVLDSLKKSKPYAIIEIMSKSSPEISISLYQIPAFTANKKTGFDLNKIYLTTNFEKGLFIAKYTEIDPLLKVIKSFSK